MKQNKNVWVIPTDKPSRVFITKDEGLGFDNQMLENTELNCQNQNIYITSNEEIKDGDYFWKPDCNMIFRAEYTPHKGCQKVILTTDQDLIKDGVQAIDDEFLEWFVNNPRCESVEIDTIETLIGSFDAKGIKSNYVNVYKIIIPKTKDRIFSETSEESKQKARDYGNFLAKQETLEEAAEKWYDSTEENKGFPKIQAFKDGAKWQSERSYSEEEVMDMFHNLSMHLPLHYEFLVNEQFKKK